MVAAHIFDLRAAASLGLRTVYIPRSQEEADPHPENIKSKGDGGEVDLVVSSLTELADILNK
jgi:FMN phosphatase YigB (HAD superfamily)